jgi:hypothetical protein
MTDFAEIDRDAMEMKNLTTPIRSEGSLRDILESHLMRLVTEHNSEIAARIHFVQTGEVINEAIRPYCAFIGGGSASQRFKNIRYMQQMAIDLNHVLHSVDEIGQYTELSELSNAQFAMVYNRLLIELKNRRLPQYAGA